MKLRRFDRTNVVNPRSSKPQLSISATGCFRINPTLGELMKLKAGMGITLLQDEEDRGNWYVATDKANGFPVREKKGVYEFNSSALKATFMASMETEYPAGAMLVGEEGVKADGLILFPVLTASLTYRARQPK